MEEPGFFWPRTRLNTEVGKKISISEKIWGRENCRGKGRNQNDLERKVQELIKM